MPCPRCAPANAPIATGVYGGRRRVVPVSRDRAPGQRGEDREADRRWRSCPGRSPSRAWCSASDARPSETLARGERDVLDGHVVLEIDERFGPRRRDMPERRDGERLRRRRGARRARRRMAPRRRAAATPAARPSRSAPARAKVPPHAPATLMPRGKFVGHEGRDLVAPARLAAEMGGQADCGILAARRPQRGRPSIGDASPVAIDDLDAAHARAAAHVDDRAPQHEPRAAAARRAHRRRDFGPRIDDRRDAETRPRSRSAAVRQPSSPVVKITASRPRRHARSG